MLLLDQGLPRTTPRYLKEIGIEAVHTANLNLSTADDVAILKHARECGQIVVTLDADFHALLRFLALSNPQSSAFE